MPSRLAKSLAKSLAIVAGLLAAALAHPLPAQTTPNLGLATPPTYSNPNTWGLILNNNFTIIDTASHGTDGVHGRSGVTVLAPTNLKGTVTIN